MRARHFLLFFLALWLVGGCETTPADTGGATDLVWPGRIISYQKAVSERHGIVGYVKEYEYAREGYGMSFRAFHVYDLDFEERGILNQTGTGVKFVNLKPETARVRRIPREEIPLQAQPLEYNVAVILGVEADGPVRLEAARRTDLQR